MPSSVYLAYSKDLYLICTDIASPAKGHVVLTIYNTAGQLVRTLIDREVEAGSYSVVWNGQDESGRAVASGIYLYRLEVLDRGFVEARKMLLVR